MKKSFCVIACSLLFFLGIRKDVYANETAEQSATDTSIIYVMDLRHSKSIAQPNHYYDNSTNPYYELKVPSNIVHIGNKFFITDTYHNQVIYSYSLNTPISDWSVMANNLELPHGIASDGKNYLILDTDRNQVCVYEWIEGGFRYTHVLEDIGLRPHYIYYDDAEKNFYVWSSMTGDMYILTYNESISKVCVKEIRHIYEFENTYIRSFSVIGDSIIFPSGTNQYITIVDKDTFEVRNRFPVPADISGMAHVKVIGNYFYFTVSTNEQGSHSTAKLIRTNNLEQLQFGEYEDISELFHNLVVPYYLESDQGYYYLSNHGSRNSIYRFNVHNDIIYDVKELY